MLVRYATGHKSGKQNPNIELAFTHFGIWGDQMGVNRKNDLILIMTTEKQDKTLELSKHWSADSTPARNEVIMKTTYPVKSVKCDKICNNY